MTLTRIPLFPLPLVLFPHANLPLHIFEPRYKQMIRECIEHETEFGIVLVREGGATNIGCTASVVEVTRQYDDGRMDIQVEGGSVFRVRQVFDEKPCLEASIETLPDEGDTKTAKIPQALLDLYGECHSLLFGSDPEAIDRDENESVAFVIAETLPLDLAEKQTILAIRSEDERLARLIPMLTQLLPRATIRHRMREKAGGNGHAHV